MSDMMGYCGLVCETCPIYLATRIDDPDEQARKRAEIAAFCTQHYGREHKPEDITDCDGCPTETGRLYSGCKHCAIRNCARQKGLDSCADCSEYPCEKLDAFFATEPSAKARLDEMRKKP